MLALATLNLLAPANAHATCIMGQCYGWEAVIEWHQEQRTQPIVEQDAENALVKRASPPSNRLEAFSQAYNLGGLVGAFAAAGVFEESHQFKFQDRLDASRY